ncbi:MAG: putative ABC exporter domain-containing protein [Acutalibacter sp.]|jgi:hypothetical protein
MKSPLVYLTATKLKNQLVGVVKSPTKLIYAVFLIALFGLTAVSGGAMETEELRDPKELTAIMTLFFTMMYLMVFSSGSSSTNSPMFTLSDVTLLFPAPMSSNKILLYGLVRQLGLSLVLGFFILFQYSWIHGLYGVGPWGLVLIIVGYGLTLFFAQLSAMACYVRTSGNQSAAKAVRYTVFGVTALYGVWAVLSCREPLLLLANGGGFEPAIAAGASFFGSLPGLLFPVSGWSAGMVGAVFAGEWQLVALFAVLLVALFAVLLGLILTCKNNYYEDVLETAETAQSAVTAQKEGQLTEVVPKNVKVGKSGLGKGWGASAIYQKHRVENRRSGVWMFSKTSLIFIAVIIVVSFFMKDGGIVGVFAFATYMQLFSVALGRFNRELIKPYIYLIPEPPLKKLLYAIKESIFAEFWEAVLIFVVVGLILGASPLEIVMCILARVSFSLLFTAGNVLVERVFGMVTSKSLIFLFYFLALILMAVPGIVAAVICAILVPAFEIAAALLAMAVVNVGISVLVLWLCRNLLQYAELNSR